MDEKKRYRLAFFSSRLAPVGIILQMIAYRIKINENVHLILLILSFLFLIVAFILGITAVIKTYGKVCTFPEKRDILIGIILGAAGLMSMGSFLLKI